MKRTTNHGFTLVELLVVIAIIGVLVSLSVPAIQAARESANRSQCQRHLGRLILGVHSYEMAHLTYPPGTLEKQGPIVNKAQGYHHNWITHLLPYIDQANTYNQIDQSVGVYHSANQSVGNYSIELLHCPSSMGPLGKRSDYAAVHHDVEAPINDDNHGVFFLNSSVRYEDVSDGTSHTIFLGEKIQYEKKLGWMSGTRATLRNTGPLLISYLTYIQIPKNKKKPIKTNPLEVGGFGSHHSHGVYFAFGDGGIRFFDRSTDAKILRQMAHRADGKLLGSASD